MKTIKLATGKELSVLDATTSASLIKMQFNTAADALAVTEDLTDAALAHVELLIADSEIVIDTADNMTMNGVNVAKDDSGTFEGAFMLIAKEPPELAVMRDKAAAYDILMGGV